MASAPIDSSTVILIRDCPRGFEILLMRRHDDMDFMAGAYVFPGGITEDDDCAEDLAEFSTGLETGAKILQANEPDLPLYRVRGLLFSAVRETFEEAGILLAYNADGNILNFNGPHIETAERFNQYRGLVYNKKITLAEIAEKENLKYGIDLLTHYSHWITPETKTAKRRFNARFFIAMLPPGQSAYHDNIEMTGSLWVTPLQAIGMYRRGEIMLMPPTFRTVEELCGFSTIDEIYAWTGQRRIYTMLPEFYNFKDGYGLRLPCDPEYSKADYKQHPSPGEPRRIVIQPDGILKTLF